MPVFRRDQTFSHSIGTYQGSTEFDTLYQGYKNSDGSIEFYKNPRPVDCYAVRKQEIYITATGDVYPCCWLGFYPETNKRKTGNNQIQPTKNNAAKYGIETAIEYFKNLERERMYICTNTCGVKQ